MSRKIQPKNRNILLIFLLILNFINLSISLQPPIIAILANSQPDDSVDIQSSRVNYQYVRWLEQSRAEAVVIQPWYTQSQIEEILSKVNGVLWQGGDRNLKLNGQYENVARIILNYVMNLYDSKGVSLPLWGTCQGFELLHSLLANSTDVLTHFNSSNIRSPIQLESNQIKNSKMFTDFSLKDIYNLQNLNTTAQFHQLGVDDSQYEKYDVLNKTLRITSHGLDLNNKSYIASVEGFKYPIYAIQFHPEMVSYTLDDENGVPQSIEAIKISQLFSNFLVAEVMKNMKYNQTMTNEDKIKYDFINAFEKIPVFSEDYYFYFFNKKQDGSFGNKTEVQNLIYMEDEVKINSESKEIFKYNSTENLEFLKIVF
jgi:gamma-glutamyl hydrolase